MKKFNLLSFCFLTSISFFADSAQRIDTEYCNKMAFDIVTKKNLPQEVFPSIFGGCNDGATFASVSYSIDNDKTKSEETKKSMIRSLAAAMKIDKEPRTQADMIYAQFFFDASERQIEYLQSKGTN